MKPIVKKSVTVVVVTYNSAELLPDFFASLDGALIGVDHHQVVVADNASADNTLEIVRSLRPDAVIVALDSNRGYAAGINAAVIAGGLTDAVLILNDDIRLRPGCVLALFEALDDADVGIAVPRLLDGKGNLLLSQRREPTVTSAFGEAILGGKRSGSVPALSEIVHNPAAYEARTDVAWASGCAWLIGRHCWDDVGPWDESFFLYAEDLDYALRVGDAGYRIRFTPNAEAVHLVGPSKSDPRLWSMSVWNRVRLFRKRHGRVSGFLYRTALVINEALRSIRKGSIHRAGLAALLLPSRRPPEVRRELK